MELTANQLRILEMPTDQLRTMVEKIVNMDRDIRKTLPLNVRAQCNNAEYFGRLVLHSRDNDDQITSVFPVLSNKCLEDWLIEVSEAMDENDNDIIMYISNRRVVELLRTELNNRYKKLYQK